MGTFSEGQLKRVDAEEETDPSALENDPEDDEALSDENDEGVPTGEGSAEEAEKEEASKAAARERGLWHLFIPHLDPDAPGTKLSNLDYAPISEQLVALGVRQLELQDGDRVLAKQRRSRLEHLWLVSLHIRLE